MLLSVLIPVYNAEKYLTPLLENLIKQATDEVEIVLLNDGSKDDSLKICKDFEKNYPDFIRVISRENKGVVRTRRELFSMAQGNWVWVIDSDDQVSEDALATLLTFFKKNDVDMILFDHLCVAKKGTTYVKQLPSENGAKWDVHSIKNLYALVANSKFSTLCHKVFKRACIDFDRDYTELENVRMTEDLMQVIFIVQNVKTAFYLEKALYIYNTTNNNSLSHSFNVGTYTSLKIVNQCKKEFMQRYDLWEKLKREYYINIISQSLSLLRRGAYKKKYKEYKSYFETMRAEDDIVAACNFLSGKEFSFSRKIFFHFLKKKKVFLSFLYLKAVNVIKKL